MLKIEKISSGYGKKQVLSNVSFTLKSGEVILLTGGNGSGKSTLLKCIYNLLPLWDGSIEFENERIDGLRTYELIRKGMVYIPQTNFCFENLTVLENLRIAGNYYNNRELTRRIDMVFEETELAKLRKQKPFYLSGGEKKLLAICMGLMHKPKLILLDEPLAGVDYKNYNQIINLIEKQVKIAVGLVIVEHKEKLGSLFNSKFIMELGSIKCLKT
jgi:ABC-type branched-subunit amino acid transport system ATPase component